MDDFFLRAGDLLIERETFKPKPWQERHAKLGSLAFIGIHLSMARNGTNTLPCCGIKTGAAASR